MTPGPWRAVDLRHQKNGQIRIFGHIGHVANVLASNANCLTDARAIALVPELMDVVQLYLRTYADTQTHPTVSQEAACIMAARAVISKYEGK